MVQQKEAKAKPEPAAGSRPKMNMKTMDLIQSMNDQFYRKAGRRLNKKEISFIKQKISLWQDY